MNLPEAIDKMTSFMYMNQHNYESAYPAGDILHGEDPVERIIIVAVPKFDSLGVFVLGEITVCCVEKENLWGAVAAISGLCEEWVWTTNERLAKRTQCVQKGDSFECITRFPTLSNFKSLNEAIT